MSIDASTSQEPEQLDANVHHKAEDAETLDSGDCLWGRSIWPDAKK
jgi:hypothetical protein